MTSLVTAISAILSLLYNIIRVSRDIVSRIESYIGNKKIKDKYGNAETIVKDGDVDKINDIINKL